MAKKKITVKTDNSGWVAPKTRKKRKPMSAEQKVAAAERLEKARQARAAKNPDYGQSSIHESLRSLPDDYPTHPNKIKVWIKTQTELASAERRADKAGVKGALARQLIHEGYVKNLKRYLRDGDYCDLFYGEYQEKRVSRTCRGQAYHWFGPNIGQPKFDVGVWYPLLGTVYTKEMYNDDNGVKNADVQKTKRKQRKRS